MFIVVVVVVVVVVVLVGIVVVVVVPCSLFVVELRRYAPRLASWRYAPHLAPRALRATLLATATEVAASSQVLQPRISCRVPCASRPPLQGGLYTQRDREPGNLAAAERCRSPDANQRNQ